MAVPLETLALVYAFILGWPESSEEETTISENIEKHTEPVEKTLALDERIENW